jgi:hypothetical protein
VISPCDIAPSNLSTLLWQLCGWKCDDINSNDVRVLHMADLGTNRRAGRDPVLSSILQVATRNLLFGCPASCESCLSTLQMAYSIAARASHRPAMAVDLAGRIETSAGAEGTLPATTPAKICIWRLCLNGISGFCQSSIMVSR